MKRVVIAIAALLVIGCENSGAYQDAYDQCLRKELFERCMAVVPQGPQSVQYNDWAEVVEECADTARDQSIRHPSQIKAECRSGWGVGNRPPQAVEKAP